MFQEKRNYNPEDLSKRLVGKPINIAETRDGMAQALTLRWSQASLALEAYRLRCYEKSRLESWILDHKLGRAFYHYMFAVHKANQLGVQVDLTPSLAGFEAALGAPPNKHKTAYRRMMNDWLDNEWCNENGTIAKQEEILHARRCYEAMEIPEWHSLASTMSAFLATKDNERRDKEADNINVLALKKPNLNRGTN
jgi:hypothetical protein